MAKLSTAVHVHTCLTITFYEHEGGELHGIVEGM